MNVYMFLQYSHVRQILTYLIFIFMRCIYICIIHICRIIVPICFVLSCWHFLQIVGDVGDASHLCWGNCSVVLFTRCHWDTVEPGLNIMSHIGRSMPQDIFWQECLVRKNRRSGTMDIFKKGGPLLGSYRIIEIYNTCFVWFQVLFLTWNHRSILKSHLQCYLKRLVLWVDTFLHSASH